MTGLLAKVLTLFFVAALADIPLICPDEQAGAGRVEQSAAEIGAASSIQSFSVSGAASTDSGCPCPCHHTFGGSLAITLAPPVRLPESPDQLVLPGISPPARSSEHPPQNLA